MELVRYAAGTQGTVMREHHFLGVSDQSSDCHHVVDEVQSETKK